jgi:hypothetical protein
MSDFIEVLAPDTLSRLQSANAEILKMISNVSKLNGNVLGAKSPAASDDAVKKLTAAYDAQEKTIQRLQKQIESLGKTRANNSKLSVQERTDNEILNRAAKEQARFMSVLTDEYEKQSITLNRLRREAKALAFVFGEDSPQYQRRIKQVQELDEKFKRVDRTLGQSQRNVGNYIGGYNGLSNSINQIARELPAAAYGFQTFAVAIGNNVPILFDAVKQANETNKALQANGQKTTSVFKQVGQAIFGFNTLLSVGLLLLGMYGREIGEWAKSLFDAKTAIDELTEAQERYQQTAKGITVNSQKELDKLDLMVRVMKDVTQETRTREQAYKDFTGVYAGYLDGLSKEELMRDSQQQQSLKYLKVLREIRSDLLLNVEAEEKQSNAYREFLENYGKFQEEIGIRERALNEVKALINERDNAIDQARREGRSEKYIEQLQDEFKREKKIIADRIKVRKEELEENKEYFRLFQSMGVAESGSVDYLGVYSEYSIVKLKEQAKRYKDALDEANKGIQDALAETYKRNVKDEKNRGRQYDPQGALLDARLRYIKEITEANDAEYEALKANREREINELEKVTNNEKLLYETRINAYGEMLKKRQDLLADDLVRQKAKLEEQRQLELSEAQKAFTANVKKAGPASVSARTKEQQVAINEITRVYGLERVEINRHINEAIEKADVENSQNVQKIAEDTTKALMAIEEQRQKIILSTEKTYRDEQIKIFQDTANNEKLMLDVRQASFRASIQLRRQQIDLDRQAALALTNGSKEQYDEVIARFEVLDRMLNKEYKEESPFAKSLKAANAELEQLKKNVMNTFLGNAGLGALERFFDGSFEKIISGFDLITTETQEWGDKMDATSERALKKFQYTFTTIADLAKTAYSFINQNNEANFQAQYARLEKQKSITIQFAGESEAAKAEIEKEYEKRRQQIAREEAKSKKEAAIFEAVINTASAVVEALPNYVLAGIVAALGAAQIAIIASQPLPEYWKGREGGKGEWALVDERGPELHLDSNNRIKSTGSEKGANKRWLAPGDKIIPHEKSKSILSEAAAFNEGLNAVLMSNGIRDRHVDDYTVNFDYDRMEKGFEKVMKSRPTLNLSVDKDGFTTHLNNRNNKINYINNRVSGKADTV